MILAIVLALAAGLPRLSLEVSSPQTKVLVGEPVKLTLKWRASVPLRLDPTDHNNVEHLEIVTSDGSGERVYREHQRRPFEDQFPLPKRGEKGLILTNMFLIDGDYGRGSSEFLFARPGRYTLKVSCVEGGKVVAQSNALSFDVEQPRGEELRVLQEAARSPWVLTGEAVASGDLLRRFPRSRYLRYERMKALELRHAHLMNGFDPDTGEPPADLGAAELTDFRAREHRKMLDELFSEDWGALEEERLSMAHSYARLAGDAATAERLRSEIVEKLPESKEAWRIKQEEAETRAAEEQVKKLLAEEEAKKPKQ